ncbi:alpha-N-arabinofuranosidase, partial [Blautia pseudococcoides]|nr:alpha-N-arabinofuranosidase [Blautia pseudococcoides]
SVTDSEKVETTFAELNPTDVTAAILTQDMNAHNTFENPDHVKEEPFHKFTVTEKGLSFTIPPCSIVSFRIK